MLSDEEKAEEYATKETNKYYGACFKTEIYKFGECKHECLVKWEASKQAYLDGLAEGRKEEDEKLFNNWCKGETPEPHECPFLQNLEKENAELKAQVEKMRKCLDEWYSQYVDKGYTEYFYKCLLEQTKSFLFTDVSAK